MSRAELETFIKLKYNLQAPNGKFIDISGLPEELKNELSEKYYLEYDKKFFSGMLILKNPGQTEKVDNLIAIWNAYVIKRVVEYEQSRD